MSSSIYNFVKQKLLTHGVQNTPSGELIITDKKLFLNFIRLERAVRLQDFAAVQSSAKAIECLTLLMGKRYLVLFAYMYLHFSDASAKIVHADVILEEGMIRKTFDYRRNVSSAERLIADRIGLVFGMSGIRRASFVPFIETKKRTSLWPNLTNTVLSG